MSTKDVARRVLPRPMYAALRDAKSSWSLRRAYGYDRKRYWKFSSTVSPLLERHNLASRITESYHNIEKGLSLPAPRPGFGRDRIQLLCDYLDVYIQRYGVDGVTTSALGALNGYVEFNTKAGLDRNDIPCWSSISTLLETAEGSPLTGGTRLMSRDGISKAVAPVELDFFTTRSSVRQFETTPVTLTDIEFAVRAAQKSPAVCNRQYSRVYVISDPERVARALKIQGGARGFSDEVPTLAVITTNIRSFWHAGERSQPWTDGGMFAMSFVLALHARGLGSVCLNWSKTPAVDRAFHAAFDLPQEEVVVMLIAFGHLRETFTVAYSPRVPVEETLRSL